MSCHDKYAHWNVVMTYTLNQGPYEDHPVDVSMKACKKQVADNSQYKNKGNTSVNTIH